MLWIASVKWWTINDANCSMFCRNMALLTRPLAYMLYLINHPRYMSKTFWRPWVTPGVARVVVLRWNSNMSAYVNGFYELTQCLHPSGNRKHLLKYSWSVLSSNAHGYEMGLFSRPCGCKRCDLDGGDQIVTRRGARKVVSNICIYIVHLLRNCGRYCILDWSYQDVMWNRKHMSIIVSPLNWFVKQVNNN